MSTSNEDMELASVKPSVRMEVQLINGGYQHDL